MKFYTEKLHISSRSKNLTRNPKTTDATRTQMADSIPKYFTQTASQPSAGSGPVKTILSCTQVFFNNNNNDKKKKEALAHGDPVQCRNYFLSVEKPVLSIDTNSSSADQTPRCLCMFPVNEKLGFSAPMARHIFLQCLTASLSKHSKC